MIEYSQDEMAVIMGEQVVDPKLSVIVVAYNTGSELHDCLQSLQQQINGDFETILVDNGSIDQEELQEFNLKYIWTGKNLGPSIARNIGLKIARADIVAFLDDDAIAQKDWTERILKEFEDSSTIALRGKIIPKNERSVLNQIQSHYDLGKKIINYYIDLEGNSAFKKLHLADVDGFKPSLFGHEGAELSFKLQKNNQGYQIRYTPSVVIFHDYADSFYHLFKKSFRHGLMACRLNEEAPEIVDYIREFNNAVPKTDKSFIVKMIIKISGAFYLLGKISFSINKQGGHT